MFHHGPKSLERSFSFFDDRYEVFELFIECAKPFRQVTLSCGKGRAQEHRCDELPG